MTDRRFLDETWEILGCCCYFLTPSPSRFFVLIVFSARRLGFASYFFFGICLHNGRAWFFFQPQPQELPSHGLGFEVVI